MPPCAEGLKELETLVACAERKSEPEHAPQQYCAGSRIDLREKLLKTISAFAMSRCYRHHRRENHPLYKGYLSLKNLQVIAMALWKEQAAQNDDLPSCPFLL